MLSRERIKEIVDMQDSLNTRTAGEDWRDKGYNWRLYAIMEAAEAIESLPYKHWKMSMEPDLANVKVELADIVHFLISAALTNYNSDAVTEFMYIGQVNISTPKSPEELVVYLDAMIAGIARADSEESLFSSAWFLWGALGETHETMYKAYMTKNVLNGHRQINGYKKGTYQKFWGFHGELVEDNVVAFHLASKIDVGEDFTSSLKSALKNKYKEVIG